MPPAVLRACTQRLPLQRAVVLSGYADPIARQHAARAGADGFFDKTSQLDGLIEFCSRHAREVYDSRR
jgi:two-component system OmpR family response regulator